MKRLVIASLMAGVCALSSFGVQGAAEAAEPTASGTGINQYVAIAVTDNNNWHMTTGWRPHKEYYEEGDTRTFDNGSGDYVYTTVNGKSYWVREGYTITVGNDTEAGKYTPLSKNGTRVDVQYTGGGTNIDEILSSVQSTVSATGTTTNVGESLNQVTAGSYSGVTNSDGTTVGPVSSWDYIINDTSWQGHTTENNSYKDGWANVRNIDAFVTTDSANSKLTWSDEKQSYLYDGQVVDYSNVYVINGKTGVFTNYDKSQVYTGTVYGLHNEVLMTVQKDGKFYSYWAAQVTDPSATMETYRVAEYQKDLQELSDNDQKLYRNDIKEVRMTKSADGSLATFQLYRNGEDGSNGVAVDGAMTFSAGGGTGGSGAAHDTYVQVSDGKNSVKLPTGSKVEAVTGTASGDAINGIKINGVDYTIAGGKTYKPGTNVQISTDGTISATDTNTTYSAGNGVSITGENNAISVDTAKVNLGYKANNEAQKTVSLATGLTFKNGDNVSVMTGANGEVTINATDTYVTNATLNGNTLTIEQNQGKDPVTVDLSSITSGLSTYKGWNVKVAGEEKAASVASDKTVTFSNTDGNLEAKTVAGKDGNVELQFNLKDAITLGDAKGTHVTINGEKGTINGLTNTTWDAEKIVSGQAATEDQLKAAIEGVNTTASAHTAVTVNDGQAAGKTNGNLVLTKKTDEKTGQDTYDIKLADDITLGDKEGNYVNISGTDGTITTSGNVYVGGKESGIVLNASDKVISGLSNTKWEATKDYSTSTQAATEAQLQQAVSNAVTESKNNDQHIQKGEYTAGKDGNVSMNIVDGNNKVTGTVTIKDVASKAELDDLKETVGDGSYIQTEDGQGNVVNNTMDVTEAIGALDGAIGNAVAEAGKHSTVSGSSNVTVTKTDATDTAGADYKVSLNDHITLGDANGKHVDINGTEGTISATNKISVGDTAITGSGVSIGDKTYISSSGLNANDQKVTNVADGEISKTSKDAVNGSQLYATNQAVINNSESINILNGEVNRLGTRIDRVGAGAAALAALHPLDFDPDAKWDFAAGYGNYRGANAVAVGAYYRPNEDLMFSVGGSMGGGENMVNAGVSVKLGSGSSHVTTSRTAMAKELKDLRATVAQLTAMVQAMAAANGSAAAGDFPDVPENHWAYDAVNELAKAGLIEGYPDGTFGGDRPLTRYEFAQIIARAIQKGAAVDSALVKEFAPELQYIRIDTVAQDKDGKPTIERVRVNHPEK